MKNFLMKKKMGIGDWGLGIGDWGLGPIPHPQSPYIKIFFHKKFFHKKFNKFKLNLLKSILIKLKYYLFIR